MSIYSDLLIQRALELARADRSLLDEPPEHVIHLATQELRAWVQDLEAGLRRLEAEESATTSEEA